ncbi:hypothetical protein SAMN04488007_3671 [Maribacter aquivivus]|uniref:Uncharacterized protein n=1 Tax=Maribacter aquivivus TaxID=228958 RepID=A0A1M6UT78_9FLAO|nr:hypothetical protein [Maribacter aquivivus]SHK72341.1 hypothetical protein SAMN04488007_3671 [Maribacter aquivivus]
MRHLFFLIYIITQVNLFGQVTHDQVSNPDIKIRGKYDSYTAINEKTYHVGDLLTLKYAASGRSSYASIFGTGLTMTFKPESPNEVIEILEFKALHNSIGSGMYAIFKDSRNKKLQIAIDTALELKEIADYDKGVTVEKIYDEMEETTSFHTSRLTIAYQSSPYIDFSIAKVHSGKYYLKAYYKSRYRLEGCFRQDDIIKIKTDLHGIIELTNVLKTECGDSGSLAYEIPENILIKLTDSKWDLMRLYNSDHYIEFKPDGNEDYFSQLANAIIKY